MCSPYVNARSPSAPLKLLSRSYLLAGWLYFHSGLLQCIMNVFLKHFYSRAHAHEGADAAASDFPTFTFSSGFLCGGEAARASNRTLVLWKRDTRNRALFSQGIKKESIYVTKYQPSLSSRSSFTTSDHLCRDQRAENGIIQGGESQLKTPPIMFRTENAQDP